MLKFRISQYKKLAKSLWYEDFFPQSKSKTITVRNLAILYVRTLTHFFGLGTKQKNLGYKVITFFIVLVKIKEK